MAVEDHTGRSYLPRTRKTRALLAILALASPKPVLRLSIASLLWSRREKEQARASLRQCVHELQDTLGYAWGHLFAPDRHNLGFRGAGIVVDVAALTEPVPHGPEILALFKSTLLEDLNGLDPAFDHWLGEERARIGRIGRTIGEGLLTHAEDPSATLTIAEDLLLIDRGHEGAWRAIIRAHAERGDRAMAVATYDRCRAALAETSVERPSPETEDLMVRIRGEGVAAPTEPLTSPAPALPLFRADTKRERSDLRLCVAPIRTLGETPDDGLAAGLTDEISAGLARFRWITCVPSLGGPATPAAAAAADVDFVLDGTIQRVGNRLRITSRLMDMRAGGAIVWAARFDRDMVDALGLQDEIGAAIVAQVDPELMAHEGRRMAGRRRDELTAQDLLLQALPALYRLERSAFLEARRLLEASLRADPDSSVAHGWLAQWNLFYVGQGWADDPDKYATEAAALSERAVMLDPTDARALTLAGHVRGYLGRSPEEAIALHDRALSLNPNLAIAWCFSGLAHSYLGDHDEALRRISQARRLSPSDPHVFFFDMALIMPHLMRGDYEAAIDVGRRAIQLNPWFSSAYKGYLAALGHMGRSREAADVLRRLLHLEPSFTVADAIRRVPLQRPEDLHRYAEGLRRAGLQEANDRMHRQVRALAEKSPVDLGYVATQDHRIC